MRAVSVFSRERQHLRTQRCDDGLGRLGRRWGDIARLLHALEIGSHGLDRLAVMLTAKPLDEWAVGHTKPEEEASAGLLVQRLLGTGGSDPVARIDICNARRDDKLGRVSEQPGGMYKAIAPHRFRNPERAIAPGLHALCKRGRFRRRERIHPRPYAELREFHCKCSLKISTITEGQGNSP